MFRDIFWMGLSSAIRLATGLLLFILIARHLGPVEFGHYMFWFNITFLCSLLANYGLSNMLLKEIAQHPESVTDALNTSLSLRLFLSVSVFICALIISIMVDRPHLLLILLLVHFADVISETLYVAYRALGHYARESQLAAYAAIIQLVFIAVAVITNQNTEVVAFAHFIGKAAQLALILPISRRTFGKFSLQSVSTAFRLARRTIAYAVDNAMGCSFGHIDSAMLRVFTNIDVVGIYQSGMRIFQGGSQAGPILANVFLPEIARQMQRKEKSSHALLALQATFLLYGLIFGLVLTYFSEQIVYFAFGENYKHLASLLPFFGLLFFIRFIATGWGVILTAAGHQGYRAILSALHLLFTLFVGSYLAYNMQERGWLIALILASLLLGILFLTRIIQAEIKIPVKLNIGAFIIGGMLFVPKFF